MRGEGGGAQRRITQGLIWPGEKKKAGTAEQDACTHPLPVRFGKSVGFRRAKTRARLAEVRGGPGPGLDSQNAGTGLGVRVRVILGRQRRRQGLAGVWGEADVG